LGRRTRDGPGHRTTPFQGIDGPSRQDIHVPHGDFWS
jgi:hypothetical protein